MSRRPKQLPDRLDFDEERKEGGKREALPTDRNLRLIDHDQASGLSRQEVIDKLKGYRLVQSGTTNPKNWVRYINTEEGILRGGGFPIRNDPDEPFIVLKNQSANFTWSIQKSNTILFYKVPKDSPLLLPDSIVSILAEYKSKSMDNNKNIVAIDKGGRVIKSDTSISGLATKINGGRNGLSKALRLGNRFKGFYLMKLTDKDLLDLTNKLTIANAMRRPMRDDLPDDVMEVIDRYYP